MEKTINYLATELAKRDKESLWAEVKDMTFFEAYNKFDGFNLTSDPIMCNNELLGLNTFFDVNYKSITITIFLTSDGACELGESIDVWVNDITALNVSC